MPDHDRHLINIILIIKVSGKASKHPVLWTQNVSPTKFENNLAQETRLLIFAAGTPLAERKVRYSSDLASRNPLFTSGFPISTILIPPH